MLALMASVANLAAAPLATALQPFVDSRTLAGAVVLAASADRVLDLSAVGFADVEAKKPMRVDALFWIASMSKPMTATALMMLVDEGKVDLDAPVERYLPEFAGQMLLVEENAERTVLKRPSRPITVRDVLSHTSGLPFMSRVERKIDSHPLSEAAVSYALTPLRHEPGTAYDYSNAGINTAGRILEKVSGLPYERFMEERLFKPLGMKDTTLRPSAAQLRRLAKSYKPNAAKNGLEELAIEQLTSPLDRPSRGPSPAGGYFSTASDVARFGQLILQGGVWHGRRLVSEASVREMTSTQTGRLIDKDHGQGGYGLGWSTSHPKSGGLPGPLAGPCGHGGAYATSLWVDPEHQLVTVFMVQHAGYPGTDGGKIQPTFTKAAVEAFGKK